MAAEADWYPDGSGQERWWTGRDWSGHTRPALDQARHAGSIQAPPTKPVDVAKLIKRPQPHAAGAPRGFRGKTVALTTSGAGALGLLLGIGLATAGTSPATSPTDAPAYVALQSRLTSVTTDRDQLKSQVADAASKSTALADAQSAVKAQQSALDDRSKALDKREAKIKNAEETTAATTRTSGSSSSNSGASSDTGSATNVSYANCAAVRAAGAAPLYRGQPGYAAHLDRDNDGVACE